jgi:glycosyltransferase involved in cell wall biosynthesis
MKTLVLITSNFPFGTGEPFIETEFPYLYRVFDRVVILSQNSSSPRTRMVPSDVSVHRYNPATSLKGFLLLPSLISRNSGLIISSYRSELKFRRRIRFRLSLNQRLFLLKKIIKAIQLRDIMNFVLKAENLSSNVIFYSFWMNSGAHAIGLMNEVPGIRIARAHASDLYEEKSRLKFLPLLEFTSKKLDAVILPSEQGLKYFKDKTGLTGDHLRISRLGVSRTFPPGESGDDPDAPFVVVSCSNLISLKRVDLIIKSLELCKPEKKILWIHFGGGPLRNELERMAAGKLGNKAMLSWEFKGHIPNRDVLKYYSDHKVDLFINTSSTEGTPVSIMEVQSFGIPVIATDVGAVSELVVEGTGTLLPAGFSPANLSQLIIRYMKMQPGENRDMRDRIIRHWEAHYNAEVNYPDFVSQVISIFDSHNAGPAGTK